MFRRLVTSVVALVGLMCAGVVSQAAYPDDNYIITDTELRMSPDWLSVDGDYPGSPRLGGGTMAVILKIEFVDENGPGIATYNVSEDATISDIGNCYDITSLTHQPYGLVISEQWVMIDAATTTIYATYEDWWCIGILVIRGPDVPQTLPYDLASWLAWTNPIVTGGDMNNPNNP